MLHGKAHAHMYMPLTRPTGAHSLSRLCKPRHKVSEGPTTHKVERQGKVAGALARPVITAAASRIQMRGMSSKRERRGALRLACGAGCI